LKKIREIKDKINTINANDTYIDND